MKKALVAVVLALALLGTPTRAQNPVPADEKALAVQVMKSVALLFEQDESGSMTMLCSTTAYRKTEKGYRFVSAAHCVKGDDDDDQAQIKFFVSSDNHQKTFVPVKLIKAGDKEKGDDFSIFEAETDQQFVVTPLGDESLVAVGDSVLDVSAPYGIGKITYFGYVSALKIDRPAIDAKVVKWNNPMIVSIGGGPGSSGSAVVSVDQKAIVGFYVGIFSGGAAGGIVVPVSQFKKFEASVDAGKYIKKPKQKSFLGSLFG